MRVTASSDCGRHLLWMKGWQRGHDTILVRGSLKHQPNATGLTVFESEVLAPRSEAGAPLQMSALAAGTNPAQPTSPTS